MPFSFLFYILFEFAVVLYGPTSFHLRRRFLFVADDDRSGRSAASPLSRWNQQSAANI